MKSRTLAVVVVISLACLIGAIRACAESPQASTETAQWLVADEADPADEAVDLLKVELEEEERQVKSDPLDKLVALGTGVHNVKLDKGGRVKTCICVGTSRISTVLGASKGKQVARQRAGLRARAAFAQWLKEDIEIRQGINDDTTIFLEGSESADEDVLNESGKAVEKSTEMINSVARALVQGFIMIGVDVNSADKEMTIVYGWSAAKARAANQIAEGQHLKPDAPAVTVTGRKGRGDTRPNKKIKDKRVLSDDASEFLDP